MGLASAPQLPLRRCYVFRNLVTSGRRGYNVVWERPSSGRPEHFASLRQKEPDALVLHSEFLLRIFL